MRSNTLKGLTYVDIVAHYGLPICESSEGCPAGLSGTAHRTGRYDTGGTIHSSRLRAKATRQRLHSVLVLVGGVVLGHDRSLPRWQEIYESNVWASKEARRTWRVIVPARSSFAARRKVLHLARFGHMRLRYHHPAVYQWAHTADSGVTNGSKAPRTSRVVADAGKALLPPGR